MTARANCFKIYNAQKCLVKCVLLLFCVFGFTFDTLAGNQWKQLQPEPAEQTVLGKIVVKSRFIACQVNYKNLYLSSDSGVHWTDVTSNLPNVEITCFALVMSEDTVLNEIVVGTKGYGMYFSNKDMSSWVSQGVTSGSVFAIVQESESLLIACDVGVLQGTLSSRKFNTFGDVLRGSSVTSLTRGVSGYLAGMSNGQVYSRTFDSQDWDRVHSNTLNFPLSSISQNGATAIAVSEDGNWLSSRDSGMNWSHEKSFLYASDITTYGSDFIAACWYQVVLVRVDSKDLTSHYLGQDIPNGKRGLGKGVCVANNQIYVTSDDFVFYSKHEVLADVSTEQLDLEVRKEDRCGYVVAAGEELHIAVVKESSSEEVLHIPVHVYDNIGGSVEIPRQAAQSSDNLLQTIRITIPVTISPGVYFAYIPGQGSGRWILFLVVSKWTR